MTDDGSGFDTAQTTGGFGLTGMHERAALAGGSDAVSFATRIVIPPTELPAMTAVRAVADYLADAVPAIRSTRLVTHEA